MIRLRLFEFLIGGCGFFFFCYDFKISEFLMFVICFDEMYCIGLLIFLNFNLSKFKLI